MLRRASREDSSVSRLGEFGLIRRLAALSPRPHRRVLLGIGDDAAILRAASGNLLLTTDLLVESIHFDFGLATPYQVGVKAILVNASDIAAMGGRPESVVVSLALRPDTRTASVEALYRGLGDSCRSIGADLVGGDTSSSPGPMFLSIAMTGSSPSGNLIRRSGGRPGDHLYITGTIGDSRAGLRVLRSGPKKRLSSSDLHLVRRHLCPTPRVSEGIFLARSRTASAMIDLSDGLASDLRHLCERSRTGASIEISRLPISPAMETWCRRRGANPSVEAIRGGEDYELLFAVPARCVPRVEARIRSGALLATRIGRLTPSDQGVNIIDAEGRKRTLNEEGFSHF